MPHHYETFAGLPTRGITYAQIMEKLRELQELYAMMAHLCQTEDSDMDKLLAKGWLALEQLTRATQVQVTRLAQNRIN